MTDTIFGSQCHVPVTRAGVWGRVLHGSLPGFGLTLYLLSMKGRICIVYVRSGRVCAGRIPSLVVKATGEGLARATAATGFELRSRPGKYLVLDLE